MKPSRQDPKAAPRGAASRRKALGGGGLRTAGLLAAHLGLLGLLLALGYGYAARAAAGERAEGYAKLAVGDAVEIGGGRMIVLRDLRIDHYPDGRLSAAAGIIDLVEGAKTLRSGQAIAVGDPLRLDSLSIYMASTEVERVVTLEGPGGGRIQLAPGEGAGLRETEASGAARITLLAFDEGRDEVVFRLEEGLEARTVSVGIGGRAGPFTLLGDEISDFSVLRAASAPEYRAVLAAMALVVAGSSLAALAALRRPRSAVAAGEPS